MARGCDIKDTASLACHASSRPQLCLATGGWICSSCCAYGTSIREWPGLKIPIMSWWAQGKDKPPPRGGTWAGFEPRRGDCGAISEGQGNLTRTARWVEFTNAVCDR